MTEAAEGSAEADDALEDKPAATNGEGGTDTGAADSAEGTTTPATDAGASRAAAAIGLSRLSGVARATLVTNILGIGVAGDAFAAAMRIPNLLQNLLGEGALNAAFVPAYSKLRGNDRAAAGKLAGAVATFLLALTAVLVVVGVLAARPLTRAVAWGFVGERFELTVTLVRITIVGAGLAVLGAWCVGVLVTQRRLFTAYVAPVLWNAVQVGVLVAVSLAGLGLTSKATALAWGVVGGAVSQLAVLAWSVQRAEPHLRLNLRWRSRAARTVIGRLGPAVGGRSALQVSAFVDLALASLLAVGAAAAIAAAQAVYLLPVALLAVAVAAAELPVISAMNDSVAVRNRTAARLLSTTYLATGVAAVYLSAAVPLSDTLFNLAGLRTAIGDDDVLLIGLVLAAYTLGLPAVVASRLCQNVLFAAGDVRTPAVVTGVRVVVAAGVAVVLMFPLDRLVVIGGSVTGFGWQHDNLLSMLAESVRLDGALPARLGAVGLAAGAAVGGWVELAVLRRKVVRRWNTRRLVDPGTHGAGFGRTVFPSLAALTVGLVGARLAGALIGDWPSFWRLGLIGGAVAATHVFVGVALKLDAARAVLSAVLAVVRPAKTGAR